MPSSGRSALCGVNPNFKKSYLNVQMLDVKKFLAIGWKKRDLRQE